MRPLVPPHLPLLVEHLEARPSQAVNLPQHLPLHPLARPALSLHQPLDHRLHLRPHPHLERDFRISMS